MAQRLTRNTRDAVLAGVAAGFADYFDIDPVLARLAFVLLVFLNGLGILFYLVCWFIMPRREQATDAPAAAAPQERFTETVREMGDKAREMGNKVREASDRVREAGDRLRGAGGKVAEGVRRATGDSRQGQVIAGSILTALGVLFLLDRLDWLRWPDWVRFANLWPLILIAIGIAMILRSGRGTGS
jgi:phage shock protein C